MLAPACSSIAGVSCSHTSSAVPPVPHRSSNSSSPRRRVATQVLQRDASNGASSSGAIQHNVLRPGTLSNVDSGIVDVAYWDLLSHPDIDESISRAKSASDAAVLRRKGHLKEQDNLIEFMRRMHETHTCEEVMVKMERWVSVSTISQASSRQRDSSSSSIEVWGQMGACFARLALRQRMQHIQSFHSSRIQVGFGAALVSAGSAAAAGAEVTMLLQLKEGQSICCHRLRARTGCSSHCTVGHTSSSAACCGAGASALACSRQSQIS